MPPFTCHHAPRPNQLSPEGKKVAKNEGCYFRFCGYFWACTGPPRRVVTWFGDQRACRVRRECECGMTALARACVICCCSIVSPASIRPLSPQRTQLPPFFGKSQKLTVSTFLFLFFNSGAPKEAAVDAEGNPVEEAAPVPEVGGCTSSRIQSTRACTRPVSIVSINP